MQKDSTENSRVKPKKIHLTRLKISQFHLVSSGKNQVDDPKMVNHDHNTLLRGACG
jgi:hypothetical protein